MSLIYIDKIPEQYRTAFANKVVDIAKRLDVEASWLMTIFNFESGMNYKIGNSIGCYGLIQFCPDKKGLDYKTINGKRLYLKTLTTMSPIEQLDWVYEYFKNYADKINSFYDMYLFNFFPVAMGKPDNYIIGQHKGMEYARTVAKQNPALDVNKDGLITITDYKKFIDNLVKKTNMKAEVNVDVKIVKATKRYWMGALIGGVLAFGMYKLYKYTVNE